VVKKEISAHAGIQTPVVQSVASHCSAIRLSKSKGKVVPVVN
jgi:hypothetical protein